MIGDMCKDVISRYKLSKQSVFIGTEHKNGSKKTHNVKCDLHPFTKYSQSIISLLPDILVCNGDNADIWQETRRNTFAK